MAGGKREGAGRPKGSTNIPKIRDYFTQDDIERVIEIVKERMATSDRVLAEVIQQIFGKAQQNIDVTTDGEPLRLVFDPAFNATPRQTDSDSQ